MEYDLFNQPATVTSTTERMRVFHNTTDLGGEDLIKREIRAGSQNEKILTFFRIRPTLDFTPYEVQMYLNMATVPITSIRRAMTDLTKLGYLEKTGEKRPGQYGDLTYAWKLKQ
jgi:hypothetical protein